ncbi:MAG: sulfatase [Polyangia bacterium]
MLPAFVRTGLVAAVLIAPLELLALAPLRPRLVITVLALLGLAGLVVGSSLALIERLVERAALRPGPACLVRALSALPVLWLLGRSLFQGGFASTLPLAAWAPLWLPLLGWLGVAAALALARPVLRWPSGPRALGLLLYVAVLLIELANRSLYRSEYPDVHAALVLIAVALAALALHVFMLRASLAITAPRHGALATVALAGVLLALAAHGLADARVRWALTTRGSHGRHLARLLQGLVQPGPATRPEPDARLTPTVAVAPTVAPPPVLAPPVLAPPAPSPSPPVAERADDRSSQDGLVRRTRGYNVLLLSVDALRADVLLPGAENERDFPNLTALLGRSRRFARAFASSAATDLSLAALLSGRISPYSAPAIEQTLPEALARTGRRTHAVLPREVLRWAGETLLLRGFHSVDRVINDPLRRDLGSHSTSAETTDRGLAFLDREALSGQPFFLWLHYFDVHEHEQIEDRIAVLRELVGSHAKSPLHKYRALLRIVDREIGRLLDELRRRDLEDRTVVLFLSDHGESLGDDPRFPESHGHTLYNQLIHIPLGLRIPDVAPGVVDSPITLIDIMPTILQLVGSGPVAPIDGVSLVPYLTGSAPSGPSLSGRPIVLNESDQYGLLLWPYKLLVRPVERLVELYDIERDFSEQRDLSESAPQKVEELRRLYLLYPRVVVDRSPNGRRLRELLARPPVLPN